MKRLLRDLWHVANTLTRTERILCTLAITAGIISGLSPIAAFAGSIHIIGW
jgi:hypothetical protein